MLPWQMPCAFLRLLTIFKRACKQWATVTGETQSGNKTRSVSADTVSDSTGDRFNSRSGSNMAVSTARNGPGSWPPDSRSRHSQLFLKTVLW